MIAGQYRTEGNSVVVTVSIVRNDAEVARFTIRGDAGNVADLLSASS